MKKSKKIMSLVLTFIMMLSVFVPTLVGTADSQKTKVIIHKILMKDANALDNHTDANKNPKYDGTKINDIKNYFGDGSKEIAGVAFDIYKEGSDGIQGNDAIFGGVADSTKKYKKVGETVLTKTDGAEFKDLEKGTYIIVENKEKTTYVGPNGEALSKAKAVPAKITLPMTLPNGSGYFDNDKNPLHLYPKNTESGKPEVEKKLGENAPVVEGSVKVGDTVPYEVTTKVKAGSTYKTLAWGDKVSAGLTFNKNVTITADNGVVFAPEDYELTQDETGFLLKLTDKGLEKVSKITAPTNNFPVAGQNKELKITLKYSATVNDKAVVENPLDNTVTLHYGNNKSFVPEPGDNNPPPVKPKNKEIKVSKSFITGDGNKTPLEWPNGLEITFALKVYNPNTNKWDDVGKTLKLTKNKTTDSFKGLDENKVYKVVEQEVKGWVPNYSLDSEGNLVVKNKKNDNPPPITPDPVVVTTYGKKFVKVDKGQQDKTLPGAKFYVMNESKDKYLALKDDSQLTSEQKAYTEAQDAYLKAVKENAANKDELKAKRDAAYKAMRMQWKWVEKTEVAKAYVLISDENGKFEITGLSKGTYYLEEFKAPDGYTLPQGDAKYTKFEVGPGTYDAEALKVNNVKVTIPQTGGMGAVIVVLCGLAVVGVGIVIKKKINA